MQYGPEVLFETCVAMKSVDDDDDELPRQTPRPPRPTSTVRFNHPFTSLQCISYISKHLQI